MPAPLVVVLLACLVGGVAAAVWLEPRLHSLLVRHARGSAWRGALVSGALQLAVLVLFGVVALVGSGLGGAVGAAVTTVAALAYSPVVLCAIPGRYDGYRGARAELRRAGARRPVDRGIAWAGGPVALVGLCVLFAVLFATYAP